MEAGSSASSPLDEHETNWEKVQRKFSAEPLVPIGCAVTGGVLTAGIISFQKGNRKLSQTMMRARVGAQTGTIIALAYGAWVSSQNKTVFQDEAYQGNLGTPGAATTK